jgi:hypothetical protein
LKKSLIKRKLLFPCGTYIILYKNYGDANFFEYGRLIEKEEDTNCLEDTNCFNVLVCNYVCDCTDSERCFQFDNCHVDICDYWIDVDAIESYAECSKESEPELFVLACIEYYGVENFGGTTYYNESQFFTESEIREQLKSYEIKL